MIQRKVTALKDELSQCRYEIGNYTDVFKLISFYSFALFNKYCRRLCNKTRTELKAKLLTSCTDQLYHNIDLHNFAITDVVHNYSDYKLSNLEKFALSFGLKFCVPPRKINPIHIKCQFESLYNQLSDLSPVSRINDALLRSRLVVLTNEICNARFGSFLSPLTSSHLNA